MKTKKILFVVNALSGGGAEASALSVATTLSKHGSDIEVIALNESGSDRKLNSDKIRVIHRNWNDGLFSTLSAFTAFIWQVKKMRPGIVVLHCELPELFCALIPLKRMKFIVVEHTSNPWAGRKFLGRFVRNILKLRKSVWVTVSSDAKPIWQGNRLPIHIPNPIALPDLAKSSTGQEKRATFIGRLRVEKRPDWLISSAVAAGLSVDIFGEGNLSENLQQKYSEATSRVKFHGFATNPWHQIDNNSIVVVPSEYEGDGMVVAEAILRGYTVLLADNPDLRRFALPEVNYFINKQELETKLKSWKNSQIQEFQIPEAIKKSLRETRDIETIVKQWEILISKLEK
jgi:glycosyltransferase involved in cell wall biosynthesis